MITDAQVEQLKKLKELADMGILTQEEFDAKKQLILADLSMKSESSIDKPNTVSDSPTEQYPLPEVPQEQKAQEEPVREKPTEGESEESGESAEAPSLSEIPHSVPEEPATENKVPVFKRKWFIALIAALVVAGIGAAASNGNKSSNPTQSSSSSTSVTEETTEPVEEEPEPVITGIEATYEGDTENGTVLDENNDGIFVTAFYDDDTTSNVYSWTIAEPQELKTGKTATVTIEYEGFTCDLTVKCTTVDPKKFKAQCQEVPYEKLARNPDNYEGEPIKIHGKVIQVLELDDGESIHLRVATSGSYDDVVLVEYTYKAKESRVLEDDTVTLWGTYGGTYTYESTSGASITVPLLFAKYLSLE